MVRHQAIGPYPDLAPPAPLRQESKVFLVVQVFKERRLTAIPPLGDMDRDMRSNDSGYSGHGILKGRIGISSLVKAKACSMFMASKLIIRVAYQKQLNYLATSHRIFLLAELSMVSPEFREFRNSEFRNSSPFDRQSFVQKSTVKAGGMWAPTVPAMGPVVKGWLWEASRFVVPTVPL